MLVINMSIIGGLRYILPVVPGLRFYVKFLQEWFTP